MSGGWAWLCICGCDLFHGALFCLQCLPALVQLVRHDDLDVKVDACWALSFLADGPQNQIQAVIDSQIIPYLVPKLQNTEPKIVMPALRTLGNIVTGSDAQTQVKYLLCQLNIIHIVNTLGKLQDESTFLLLS